MSVCLCVFFVRMHIMMSLLLLLFLLILLLLFLILLYVRYAIAYRHSRHDHVIAYIRKIKCELNAGVVYIWFLIEVKTPRERVMSL